MNRAVDESNRAESMIVQACLNFYRDLGIVLEFGLISNRIEPE